MAITTIPNDQDPRRPQVANKSCWDWWATPPPLPKDTDFPSLNVAMSILGFKPRLPVMNFPLELREEIWAAGMLPDIVYGIQVRHCTGDPVTRPGFYPPCLWVSKQIHEEMVPVFIRTSTFEMNSIWDNEYLCKVLDAIPHGNGRTHVRSLRFNFFDCCPQGLPVNQDLALAVSCPGLTLLDVTIHSRRVQRPIEAIVDHYHLEELVKCKSLQLFVIRRKCGFDDVAMDQLRKLAAWVEGEFKQQGQTVECKIV